MIREDLLQFIWLHKLLKPLPLITTSGKELRVLKTGELNRDSGPDFFNARIEIENLVLAGNIEIHVNSSDWLKHKHQKDNGYDNIILHVVYSHDKEVEQNTRFNVEVLELKKLISEETLRKYEAFSTSKNELACANQLSDCDDFHTTSWLDRVLVERIEKKEKAINDLFNSVNGNYIQTFFTLLLKGFGYKVNAGAFEILGRKIPSSLILRHANDLKQTEAMLLGMAGLLDESFEEKYVKELQNEFEFLKQKYSLVPIPKKLLKYSRMRPSNFPDLRLAQFAALLHHHPDFFQAPYLYSTNNDLKHIFNIRISEYWKNHYRLGLFAKTLTGTLGKASIDLLFINAIVPFLFFYGNKLNKPELKEHAISLLEHCAFENNQKTRLFMAKDKLLVSAAQSQACIQLYDQYCSKKRCLDCGIATSILKDNAIY